MGKNKQKPTKKFPFMPRRIRDNSGKFLPNTPAAPHSQPSLFFGGCNQEEPLGEQPDIFEEPIREEEEENIPLEPMAENINARGNTSSSNSSIKGEIGKMLEDFKSEMLQILAMQMDTLHIKRKQEEAERALAIFCHGCTKRHPRNECPLNSIGVCSVCEEDHSTDKCPTLSELKAIYQGARGVTE